MVIHPITIVLLAIVLITQGTWVFLDARKRGENYWLWGLFCLFSTPVNPLIYLLVTRMKKIQCPDCGQTIRKWDSSCPSCGGGTSLCPSCHYQAQVGWAYCPQCGCKIEQRR